MVHTKLTDALQPGEPWVPFLPPYPTTQFITGVCCHLQLCQEASVYALLQDGASLAASVSPLPLWRGGLDAERENVKVGCLGSSGSVEQQLFPRCDSRLLLTGLLPSAAAAACRGRWGRPCHCCQNIRPCRVNLEPPAPRIASTRSGNIEHRWRFRAVHRAGWQRAAAPVDTAGGHCSGAEGKGRAASSRGSHLRPCFPRLRQPGDRLQRCTSPLYQATFFSGSVQNNAACHALHLVHPPQVGSRGAG